MLYSRSERSRRYLARSPVHEVWPTLPILSRRMRKPCAVGVANGRVCWERKHQSRFVMQADCSGVQRSGGLTRSSTSATSLPCSYSNGEPQRAEAEQHQLAPVDLVDGEEAIGEVYREE